VVDQGSNVGGAADANRAALQRSLDAQREHALGIVDGLTGPQLRAPKLPSGWNCLGLINHLAIDVERYWFTSIMGGEPIDAHDGDGTRNWRVGPVSSPAEVLDRYRTEIAASDEVIATRDLEAPPAQRDPWWGEWQVPDMRFVLLHVIAETACHAGHLDAARELTDGRVWLSL
jgi:hypothetical protein